MKKMFGTPVIDILKYNVVDVITTSVETGENEGDIDVGG